jgi:hypothetical protein
LYEASAVLLIVCRDIWNRFLEFESNIGDLASIVKVEKRRSSILGQVGTLSEVPFICAIAQSSMVINDLIS